MGSDAASGAIRAIDGGDREGGRDKNGAIQTESGARSQEPGDLSGWQAGAGVHGMRQVFREEGPALQNMQDLGGTIAWLMGKLG